MLSLSALLILNNEYPPHTTIREVREAEFLSDHPFEMKSWIAELEGKDITNMTVIPSMIGLALDIDLVHEATDFAITLFTGRPFNNPSSTFEEWINQNAVNSDFGIKELERLNDILWSERDIDELRRLASAESNIVCLLTFTQNTTVTLYKEISASINYGSEFIMEELLRKSAVHSHKLFLAVYFDIIRRFGNSDNIKVIAILILLSSDDEIIYSRVKEIIEFGINPNIIIQVFQDYAQYNSEAALFFYRILPIKYNSIVREMRDFFRERAYHNDTAETLARTISRHPLEILQEASEFHTSSI